MNRRMQQFVQQLKHHRLDGYFTSNDTNITYLTEFGASESWLLVSPKAAFYITDFRYILEAKKGLKDVKVVQYTQSLFATLFDQAKAAGIKRLGFDSRHISLFTFQQLKKLCPKGIELVAVNQLIEDLRAVKEKKEVDLIRAALKLHHQALVLLKRLIRPGVTEREVFLKLEQFVKARGADFSFDPIIAGGPNSCYPHARVTDRRLRNNEPVLVDFGIDIKGYKSDLTRIFFLGKIAPLVKEVYNEVAIAQQRAIESIRPGIKACDVDFQARNYLKEKKLANFFGHSLGHGVGLDIHEAPRLSHNNPVLLKPGMVITIEPAVYIPNKFGIRIEDMILVTEKGYEILSR